ncbi:15625_t:CDS:2, partial [Acaulospora morrowiae]
ACSSILPPRLEVLLDGYVKFRKQACESAFIFYHPLADITVANLEMIARPDKEMQPETTELQSNERLSKQQIIVRAARSALSSVKLDEKDGESCGNRKSLTIAEMFPEIIDSLNTLKRRASLRSFTGKDTITDDSKETAQKFGELTKNEGNGIMSEEVLNLLFTYDDRQSNRDAKSFDRRRSTKLESIGEISIHEEKDQMDPASGENDNMLERNDSGCSMRNSMTWCKFEKLGFSEPLTETITVQKVKGEVHTSGKDKHKNAKSIGKERKFRFLCVKQRPESENSCFSIKMENIDRDAIDNEDWEDWYIIEQFPYFLVEVNNGDTGILDEWVLVEPKKEQMNDYEWIVSEKKKKQVRGSLNVPWIKSNRYSSENNIEKVKLFVIPNKDYDSFYPTFHVEFSTSDMIDGVSMTPTKHQSKNPKLQQQSFGTITTEITSTQTSYVISKPLSPPHPTKIRRSKSFVIRDDKHVVEETISDSDSEYSRASYGTNLSSKSEENRETDEVYQPDEIYDSYMNDRYSRSVVESFSSEKNAVNRASYLKVNEYPVTIQNLPWPPTNYPPPPQDYSRYYQSRTNSYITPDGSGGANYP